MPYPALMVSAGVAAASAALAAIPPVEIISFLMLPVILSAPKLPVIVTAFLPAVIVLAVVAVTVPDVSIPEVVPVLLVSVM